MSTLARVTGTVLSVPEPFRGIAKATGNPFVIETVKVLVANADVTTLNFNRDDTGRIQGLTGVHTFKHGDPIDVLVEVGIYRNEPQFQLARAWVPTEEEALAGLDYATGALAD